MWIFDRYSPYSYQNNREKYIDDDEKREFTLKECLWFCMTSLTPQGGGKLNTTFFQAPKISFYHYQFSLFSFFSIIIKR
jgi:hypothetical protein